MIRRSQKGSGGWLPRSSPAVREVSPAGADPVRVASSTPPSIYPSVGDTHQPSWLSEMLDGHIRFTLSYPVVAGVAVGLLVLLVVSFELGRRLGAPSPVTDNSHFDDAGLIADKPAGPDTSSTASREPVHVPGKSDSAA